MTNAVRLDALLQWRLAQAALDAPPAPNAAYLLARANPPRSWWEAWPARWQASVERLGRIRVAYGHALTPPADRAPERHGGYPVPVLLARAATDAEGYARVLYLSVRDGQLRLRFLLDVEPSLAASAFEVLFVTDDDFGGTVPPRPALVARAERVAESEYRLDAELPDALARGWAPLRVTDPMPFRFVLRPVGDGAPDPS